MADQSPYKMSISMNVLNHLGIGLYSNTPAVLSELVANAWDAEATHVTIEIHPDEDEIIITDDGLGMTLRDINDRFLTIGYDKRTAEGEKSQNGKRDLMGRKGIGKLAVFRIADVVEVYTVKNNERNALMMSTEDIKRKIKEGGVQEYEPDALDPNIVSIQQGTKIVLKKLKNKELERTAQFLKRRVARRFSVIGASNDFRVFINGEEITTKDREFYDHIQFIWYLGSESAEYVGECKKVDPATGSFLVDNVVSREDGYTVTGWVGTVDEPKRIGDANNAIVIYAHGKLIQEDILKDFNEAAIYSEYLMGEINADFMDLTGEDDIVTSNRQSVNEDDPRYRKVHAFVGHLLDEIEKKWSSLRRKEGLKRALDIEAVNAWYQTLKGDDKHYAEQLFGKIESFRIKDLSARRELYKYGILAFERMRLDKSLSLLDKVETDKDLDILLAVFKDIDGVEAALYHQIVKSRIDVIKKFKAMLETSRERALQEYLFDHLWLLDASWERASTDIVMEKSFKKSFPSMVDGMTAEEANGRFDIRYRTAAGKHIILELKKYDLPPIDIYKLMDQAERYVLTLKNSLKATYPHDVIQVECICILGKPPHSRGVANVDELLKNVQARYITYEALIQMSLEGYTVYLEKDEEVSRIQAALAALDADPFETETQDEETKVERAGTSAR